MTEHQSLSDYYNKTEVDNKVQDEAIAREAADKALDNKIPTMTSQLDNDSGFLTINDTIENANRAGAVDWPGVENTPTTLSGYGITDAATKAEFDSLAAEVGTANAQLEEIA